MLNKSIMKGNLCQEPVTRTYNQNKTYVHFNIAVSRQYNKEETDFFNCIAFGKTAEFIQKYFHKGQPIIVVGEMHNNNYTQKDGSKVYGMQLVVNEVDFASKKEDNSNYVTSAEDIPEMPFN